MTTSTNDPTRPPRPETTRAILISAGIQRPTTTVHHYVETRLVTVKGPDGEPQKAWAHYFECFRTGATRVWGIEKTAADIEREERELAEEAN